ncbi:hypothetical protein LguiB_020040 [Lonicera macranthoides]
MGETLIVAIDTTMVTITQAQKITILCGFVTILVLHITMGLSNLISFESKLRNIHLVIHWFSPKPVELTVVVLAYGLQKNAKDYSEKNVLIFYLGADTFNVDLFTMEQGFFYVKASIGQTHLEGGDFVNRVVNYFAEEFERNTRIFVPLGLSWISDNMFDTYLEVNSKS